ncbi:hypothetical protein [Phyllobacterium sophorae]|uniref:hypothetical protein n=1 Tax=Phyllobacterium sophorae TaxID=1520277 RepID=UPI0013AEBC0E|nr:hypothetical protein [Phyllobacterium sophorae]
MVIFIVQFPRKVAGRRPPQSQDNEPVVFKSGMTEEELNSSKLASQIDCKVHHAKTGGIAIDRSARNGKQRHRHRRKDGSYTTAVGDKAIQWPQQ